MLNKLNETSDFLKKNGIDTPEVGLVLGTGLGDLTNHVEVVKSFNYDEIPHFPLSTVEFHKGKLIYGNLGNKRVIIMQGRFHYYEGYTFNEIVYPIRAMKLLGIKHLLLSNAAGGINLDYKKGDLIAIDDHINLLPGNPLIGVNHPELGDRFPDMSLPYSKEITTEYRNACEKYGVKFRNGVYVSVAGPNLETRAEYRFLRRIGADMVGMSTVPEVIAANHMKLPCFAVSVITDECDPDNLKPIDIQEIIEIAGKSDKTLSKLFIEIIKNI